MPIRIRRCHLAPIAALLFFAACGGGGGSSVAGGGSGGGGGAGGANAPDLVVDLVTFDPASAGAGTSISVSDTISNTGASDAAAVRVGLYLSSDATITTSDRLIGFRSLATLASGATSSGGGSLTVPANTVAGTYWIGAIVDDTNSIAERTETNNARASATTIAISAANLADLEVQSVSVGQTSALAGGPLDVSDTVVNTGTNAATAFQVGIYLSTDATITTQDVLLGLRPVASLAPGATSSAGDTLTLPGNLTAGAYWVGAIADAQNQVVEPDELDNARAATSTVQISVPPRANLVVQSFTLAPTTIDAGLAITLNDTVANLGNGPAASFDIAVYLSSDAQVTRADTRLGVRTLALLAPGATDSATGQLAIPADTAGGTYWVGAIVDDGLDVLESNEGDNVRVAPTTLAVTVPPRPDLVPQAISFTPGTIDTTIGTVLHVTESVINSGLVPAGPFRVGVYLSSNDTISVADVLLASRTVNGLAVGASSGSIADITLPTGVSAGTYYVGVVVDDQQAMLEMSEGNDALLAPGTLDVVASPVPLPDLVMQSVSFSPHNVAPGEVIQVQNEVRNQGNLSAGAFQVGIFLSTDDVIATDDRRIGGRSVAQLGIHFGSAASAPFTVPASVAPGTYYIGAIADDQSQVAESLELNNGLRASGALIVALPPPPQPDLIVQTAGFTPNTAAQGATVQLSATLKNQGTANAGAFRVAFYASTDTTVDATDTLLGFQTITNLDVGQTFVGTIGATIPASLAIGNYSVGVIVDDVLAVAESVETNNVLVPTGTLHIH